MCERKSFERDEEGRRATCFQGVAVRPIMGFGLVPANCPMDTSLPFHRAGSQSRNAKPCNCPTSFSTLVYDEEVLVGSERLAVIPVSPGRTVSSTGIFTPSVFVAYFHMLGAVNHYF